MIDTAGEPIAVTWEAPDADTWELQTDHGSALPAVPLRNEFETAFAEGFRRTFAALGLPLSHIETRHINGWPYISFFLHDVPRKAGDPPPPLVLKAITRLHPGFRRRTRIARTAIAERRPQGLAQQWFDERDSWIRRILDVQSVELDTMSNSEVAEHLRRVSTLVADAIRRHFELVPGSIPLGEWLARVDSWGLPRSESRRAVMHGTPVHVEARQRLQRIAAALDGTPATSLGQIANHGPEAAAALDDYLAHHGWWTVEDRLSSPLVRDFPDLIVHTIRQSAAGEPVATTEAPFSDLLARLRMDVSPAQQPDFDRLAEDAQRAHAMLDDNSGILASWTVGLATHTLRAVADRLEAANTIDKADHIWALSLDEILALLTHRNPLSTEQVAERHRIREAQAELDPPPHLNGPPGPPPDPDVFPEPVARLVRAMTTFLADKFNYAETVSGIGDRRVEGRAVVAADASDAVARIEPGDILVTTATTPAYNTILPIVAGIVVSQGGPSCHAAIVARELGIPALVGYPDATTTIPDGTRIEIDPQTATLVLLPVDGPVDPHEP